MPRRKKMIKKANQKRLPRLRKLKLNRSKKVKEIKF